MIDSMVFDNEVITILDDAGNEVKKNVKHLNVIEPELSIEQKREIARTYTNNLKDYVIKDFAHERIPEMRKKIQELVLQGYRPDKVQELLEKEYGIASRKAKFLAQNETSIMLAEYKKVTYKEMGFDKFIWKTIIDGRERDRHKELDGKIFSYDNPSYVDAGKTRTGLPGEDFNCRCTAIPFREGNLLIKTEVKNGQLQLAKNSSNDDIEWITVKGNHIPIKKGQTKEEAVKDWLAQKHDKSIETKNPAEPPTDGVIKDTAKKLYKIYKESNCESAEPAYQYPKTIAGVKRGKPMNFHQADNGRANPKYNPRNELYYRNCQACVVAHEARMRGYDVQAAPRNLDPKSKSSQLAANSSWAWLDSKTGKKCEYKRINVSNAKKLYDYFEKNIKQGERYQTVYYWGKNEKIYGHVLTIARDETGELRLYDPQTNIIFSGKDVKKYYSRRTVIFNNSVLKPKLLRVDDKKFNPYFVNDVLY